VKHVFATMGTVVSLDLPANAASAVASVDSIFADYDARFSVYRPASELSRIARGEWRLGDSSERMLDAYGEALVWRQRTDGAFTPHRPDGVIDLNGLVKALAMRDAGRVVDAACDRWCLNVGGDVLVRGGGWTVGVVDPTSRTTRLLAIDVEGARRAVATSGTAERGDHIWRGGSTAAPEYTQVTVVADDIVTADVLATAIVAGGRATLDDAANRFSIDALTVDAAGGLTATPGFRAALAVAGP
jgi:thiamine biosynthesis lipoprotein